jgi:cytoskeletal protein CcmA (bactofilin family)
MFAINSYDTLKLKTFDGRISISGDPCEKTITFDLNNDVSFNNIDVAGDTTIAGKLTVGGLIDPTGLVLEQQATVPHTNTATQGTIWVNGNDLKFTDSTATTITLGTGGGGGGGGGGVDSKWKEKTEGQYKFLEPSGTDISGIILKNLWATESLDISGNVDISGNLDVSGNLEVSGNFLIAGDIIPTSGEFLILGDLDCDNLTVDETLKVALKATFDDDVRMRKDLDVSGGNVECESLDISGGRITYSVGNDWVHSGSGNVETIPITHAVVQASGGSVGNAVSCDISVSRAKKGQILIILVPARQELDFRSATNVVVPTGGALAKANTSVQFVFNYGKWWPMGLQS